MLDKNIDKARRRKRANQWTGYKPKVTPTKKEKENKIQNKYKNIERN